MKPRLSLVVALAAAGFAPVGHADTSYGPLKRVGVSAGPAVIEGKILTVTVTLKRRTELRLAVVDGDDIQAFVTVLNAGGAPPIAGVPAGHNGGPAGQAVGRFSRSTLS